MLRLRTTYPGQEPRELVAPLYMVRNIALFGHTPPFIEIVGFSKELGELTGEEVALWAKLEPLIVKLRVLGRLRKP